MCAVRVDFKDRGFTFTLNEILIIVSAAEDHQVAHPTALGSRMTHPILISYHHSASTAAIYPPIPLKNIDEMLMFPFKVIDMRLQTIEDFKR